MRRLFLTSFVVAIVASVFTLGLANAYSDENPASAEGETWTLPLDPPAWARNDKGFVVSSDSLDGQKTTHVVHKTPTDWAIRIPKQISTKSGRLYELTCKIKNVGPSSCETGVVLYGSDDQAIEWSYGGTKINASQDWQTISSKFIVPDGVTKIEPRLIGQGETNVYVLEYQIKSVGEIQRGKITGTLPAENAYLRVVFHMDDASFSIRDVRTGRVWNQTVAGRSQFVTDAKPVERGMQFQLLDSRTLLNYTATIQLEKDAPELVVTMSAPKETAQESGFDYPYPFQSKSTDRIILPVNEGISFPATEEARGVSRMIAYGGHGLCMAFWAIVDDVLDANKSSGLMGILETPDDSEVETQLRAVDPSDKEAVSKDVKTLAIGCRWNGSMRKFGYDRVLRLIAIDKGGYVAACKRYREYAKKIGLLVTFDDKIKRNPKLAKGIDLLVGAANIWCWDGNGVKVVPKLQELGFDHVLWSNGGSAQELVELNKTPGVLTSRYDIYQDIMDPARYDELPGIHGDWIPEAWPQDLAWDSPDGHWTRGWEVDAKEPGKPRIPCGVLCDSKSVQYAEKRVGDELKEKPYLARFLDTTVASPWRECWNPDHPMTRTQCKIARMQLLGLLGSKFDLVCGSETGIDASVPYCDFYEGMMSLGPYRCPESGRYIERIWDEVPEVVEKYQCGETYRLPLFELVYHGCVVSYWYWGDHNNKFPSLLKKRNLFNALYGVPPMYGFTSDYLEKNKEQFRESYKVAEPVSRLTGRVEMTDHQILTPDRSVQKSVFANGVEAIVNFGSKDYRCEDGEVVAPESVRVIENR